MKIFGAYYINYFVICCGYKGYVIKECFANYALHMSDVTFNICMNFMEVHRKNWSPGRLHWSIRAKPPWLADVSNVCNYVQGEAFCFPCRHGVADVEVTAQIAHHHANSRLATLTAD